MTDTITIDDELETAAEAAAAAKKPRTRRSAGTGKGGVMSKLIAAIADMPSALRDSINPFSKSKYASIASVINAAKLTLKEHGLGFIQPATTRESERGIFVCVETIVSDGENDISSGVLEIPVAGNNVAQAIGSAITYARRYSLVSFLGIATDDDDGNSAGGAPAAAAVTVCPPALEGRAREAERQGPQAYQAFWHNCSNGDRAALTQSGIHGIIKRELGL